MLKSIFYLIRHFPEQVFLFVFNSGIFVWLWKSGNEIANQLGVTAAWENHVPAPIQVFFGQNIEAVQGCKAVSYGCLFSFGELSLLSLEF